VSLAGSDLQDQVCYLFDGVGLDEFELVILDGVVIETGLEALDRPYQWVYLDGVLRAARGTGLLQNRKLVSHVEDAVAAPDVAKNRRKIRETK